MKTRMSSSTVVRVLLNRRRGLIAARKTLVAQETDVNKRNCLCNIVGRGLRSRILIRIRAGCNWNVMMLFELLGCVENLNSFLYKFDNHHRETGRIIFVFGRKTFLFIVPIKHVSTKGEHQRNAIISTRGRGKNGALRGF